MNTSTQHSFSSVLSINPYKETYFSGISSFITETTSPKFSKDQFVISYISTKEFINAQIAISKNIPEEDLFDAISNKAYDELALDQAVEYKIRYIESFDTLDEENRYFHVFIVDPLDITNTFIKIVEKVKYIDVIIPSPLLIKSLYTKELIDSNGVHCFIYIQENDAFLTIYGNKEFVYTKSLKYSLVEMHERFCELYGERIEYNEFIRFFSKENLKETTSDYKEFFIRLYKELFANINDILTYAKRAFDIEKFEHVYIGAQLPTVTKLYEMLEVELNIKSSEFEFDYGFETENEYVDQLHALMHIYTTLPKDEIYECNFTDYRRPPKFIKRESGKLIILIFASFALAFAYPITYWILTYVQTLQEDLLKQEYKEIHNIKITREATIKNRKADKEKSLKLLAKEKTEYSEKKNTLMKIHEVKVDYPMKAKLLTMFTKNLNKYGVKIEEAKYAEDNKTKILTFYLVANNDRKITKLVEYLTKIYEGKYKFILEEIVFDEKTNKYFSELKVRIL
ncbi:hypothetical protein LCX93_08245 [Sulfurimonas sp. SWIR-19]|uniref:hypothetical protein n=1 Tax=Sulfurimonas sp. SWIR-19 TaxID=2878390 RepID=UPI001CF4AA3D|nr:hypothetical protein [Sulfurimonas sp. SWIR-19]UCM99522.1 hypothetical protein LCX93_08245 [Sulfurimonas sp. SWIR-19]